MEWKNPKPGTLVSFLSAKWSTKQNKKQRKSPKPKQTNKHPPKQPEACYGFLQTSVCAQSPTLVEETGFPRLNLPLPLLIH